MKYSNRYSRHSKKPEVATQDKPLTVELIKIGNRGAAVSQQADTSKTATPALANGEFQIVLNFLSDWHIGSGTGVPGYIDSLIRLDADRLPFVPGKTLHGIWRDACETVAAHLPESKSWRNFVDVVFGHEPRKSENSVSGESGALLLPSLRLSEAMRREVITKNLQDDLTVLRPGIAIDSANGQTRTNFLRLTQLAIAELALGTVATLELDGDAAHAARALLWAGSGWLESLGGDRRRGPGRCRLSVPAWQVAKDEFLSLLEGNAPSFIQRRLSSPLKHHASKSPEAIHINVDLILEQPVVVARSVLGNLVQSFDFIPGTQLLPALMPHLTALCGHANESTLRHHISRGGIRICHAYPKLKGKRALPLPMCLHSPKQKSEEAAPDEAWNPTTQSYKGQLKQLRSGYGFLSVDKNELYVAECKRQQVTHSTIEDANQRPTSEVGGVYTYEAIAAGQPYAFEMRVDSETAKALAWDKATLRALNGLVLRLGLAKKTDYGRARIAAITEAPHATNSVSGTGLWLHCLSDLLLLDAVLQPRADVDTVANALSAALANLRITAIVKVDETRSFARMRRSEGFHGPSLSARPSYIGIMAGSVYWVDFSAADGALINKAALLTGLATIQHDGLGQRRAEGYGEVSFSTEWSIKKPLVIQRQSIISTNSVTAMTSPLTDNEHRLVTRLIKQRAFIDIERKALEIATVHFVRHVLKWSSGRPSRSQLAGLRNALLQGDIEPWRSLFKRHVDEQPEKFKKEWADAGQFWCTDAPLRKEFAPIKLDNSECWYHAAICLFFAAMEKL